VSKDDEGKKLWKKEAEQRHKGRKRETRAGKGIKKERKGETGRRKEESAVGPLSPPLYLPMIQPWERRSLQVILLRSNSATGGTSVGLYP
jgi:hypothetical protein